MEGDDPAIINIMRTLFFLSLLLFFHWMGLPYFIMHASCFSAKDSKRGVCRTQKACRSLYYLSEPIEKSRLLSFYDGGGVLVMTHISVVFISSLQQHCNKTSLACHDTTEQVFSHHF